MSSSRHPVALRLEGLVGGDTRLLATVMALPLVDGIFPALVLAGALDGPTGVLEVGLLIFGGSATLAVVLAEMRAPPGQAARSVLVVGTVLILGAAVEAALAPTIESLVRIGTFERFAALVVAAIAAKTASARIGEYLPGPGVIVGLGFLASVDPAGARFVVDADPVLVARAAAAAGVGTGFALAAALLGPRLREVVDLDRFRFASAVALGLLPLSILGLELGHAPLLVVGVAGLLAYDPEAGGAETRDPAAPTPDRDAGAAPATDRLDPPGRDADEPPVGPVPAVADGGDDADSAGPDHRLDPGGCTGADPDAETEEDTESDPDPETEGDTEGGPDPENGSDPGEGSEDDPGEDAEGDPEAVDGEDPEEGSEWDPDAEGEEDPDGAAVLESDDERAPWL